MLLVAESVATPELEPFCNEREIAFRRLPNGPRGELDRELTDACTAARLDLLCLSFDRLVPPALVAALPQRILNVHMGLLPATRGLHPLRQTLASGVTIGGATIHEVTNDVDAGPIIAQCVVPVLRRDTPDDLGARVFPLVRDLLCQTLAWYVEGRVRRAGNQVVIDGARYDSLPVCPSIERTF